MIIGNNYQHKIFFFIKNTRLSHIPCLSGIKQLLRQSLCGTLYSVRKQQEDIKLMYQPGS